MFSWFLGHFEPTLQCFLKIGSCIKGLKWSPKVGKQTTQRSYFKNFIWSILTCSFSWGDKRLVHTYDASISTRKVRVNRDDASTSVIAPASSRFTRTFSCAYACVVRVNPASSPVAPHSCPAFSRRASRTGEEETVEAACEPAFMVHDIIKTDIVRDRPACVLMSNVRFGQRVRTAV